MQEHRFTYPTVRPIWPNRSAAPAGATIAAHYRPRPGAAHDPLLTRGAAATAPPASSPACLQLRGPRAPAIIVTGWRQRAAVRS